MVEESSFRTRSGPIRRAGGTASTKSRSRPTAQVTTLSSPATADHVALLDLLDESNEQPQAIDSLIDGDANDAAFHVRHLRRSTTLHLPTSSTSATKT